MAARVILKMYGTITITRVAIGRISNEGACQKYVPGGGSETAGRTWMTTVARRMMRPMPTTNSGSEVTDRNVTEEIRSNQPPFQSAAANPDATPSKLPMAPLAKTRPAELIKRG